MPKCHALNLTLTVHVLTHPYTLYQYTLYPTSTRALSADRQPQATYQPPCAPSCLLFV